MSKSLRTAKLIGRLFVRLTLFTLVVVGLLLIYNVSLRKANERRLTRLQSRFPTASWLIGIKYNTYSRNHPIVRLSEISFYCGVNGWVQIDYVTVNESSFSDAHIALLNDIDTLRYVNLSSTSVTADGLWQLLKAGRVVSVQCYDCNIPFDELRQLQKDFPHQDIIYELTGHLIDRL